MLQRFDERNRDLQVWVGDRLFPRAEARVSVFDSSVQGGDAVWEGLRVYEAGVLHLGRHLRRLYDSAHGLAFAGVPDEAFVRRALAETLAANGMTDAGGAHVRLTLTRGEKITSGMDPRLNQAGCTLIVLAEWKPPVYDNAGGIAVVTSAIRRNAPGFLDSKLHHNNLLNNIQAKLQANAAGADAALLLDERGFAAELHGTNVFCARDGALATPRATACLPGITRGWVLELAAELGIPTREADLSLSELYAADEFFCTGTMGELTPIRALDGRAIRGGGEVLARLRAAFETHLAAACEWP